MNQGIILYQSKYGSTLKYATWLSEKLSFDLMETKKATPDLLKDYETIILGGGIYASGIAGLNFLKQNYSKLADKKIAVFCSGASPYYEEAYQEIYQHNFTGDIKGLPCFYYRGAFLESKMNFIDRNLCKMLKKSIAKKDPSTYQPWEAALMSSVGGEDCDWTDEALLEPIIAWYQSL